jgi:hypothetical protein
LKQGLNSSTTPAISPYRAPHQGTFHEKRVSATVFVVAAPIVLETSSGVIGISVEETIKLLAMRKPAHARSVLVLVVKIISYAIQHRKVSVVHNRYSSKLSSQVLMTHNLPNLQELKLVKLAVVSSISD